MNFSNCAFVTGVTSMKKPSSETWWSGGASAVRSSPQPIQNVPGGVDAMPSGAAGGKALVCVNGGYGTRMVDVAERCGAVVEQIEATWGTVFDQDEVIAAVERVKPAAVAIVHAETSPGAHQPVDKLGEAIHARGP